MNEFRFICVRLILDERVLKILSVTERHKVGYLYLYIYSKRERLIWRWVISFHYSTPGGNKPRRKTNNGLEERNAASTVSEIFVIFGQNADDLGKSTREKTFLKIVKRRLVG